MALATSTLLDIQKKVRRLTRSPSVNQLSDNELNQYINTFIAYDFPEHLRLFNLHTTFTFFTEPYVSEYDTNTTDPNNPLYDFQNKYLTINPPIYIAGFQSFFSQDRSQFFGMYPNLNTIQSIGPSGNGATTQFTGTINSQQVTQFPFVQNNTQGTVLLADNVLFSSVDLNNNGLAMIDVRISPSIGNLTVPNVPLVPPFDTTQDPNNYINYLTGQYVVTFPTAPGAGIAINSQTVIQQPTRPYAMLFYDGKFTMRPVPDQPYRIQMEVYQQPTQLLLTTDVPNLKEFWQYIAYGAAKKVLEDRMDLETVQMILPEFLKQQTLVLRRTIVQQSTQRTSTIYTEENGVINAYGPGFFSGGSQY
jgi:hypothetical protein